MKNNNKWQSFGKALGEVAKQVADATAQAAEANARIEKLRREYESQPSKRVIVSWKRIGLFESVAYSEQLVYVEGKSLRDYLVVVPDYTSVSGLSVRVVDATDHSLLYDLATFSSSDVTKSHRERRLAG